jgi:hypothetical protein
MNNTEQIFYMNDFHWKNARMTVIFYSCMSIVTISLFLGTYYKIINPKPEMAPVMIFLTFSLLFFGLYSLLNVRRFVISEKAIYFSSRYVGKVLKIDVKEILIEHSPEKSQFTMAIVTNKNKRFVISNYKVVVSDKDQFLHVNLNTILAALDRGKYKYEYIR